MKNSNTNKHVNDLTKVPAAACSKCGGWHSRGGMKQYANSTVPVVAGGYARTGCTCGLGCERPFVHKKVTFASAYNLED